MYIIHIYLKQIFVIFNLYSFLLDKFFVVMNLNLYAPDL